MTFTPHPSAPSRRSTDSWPPGYSPAVVRRRGNESTIDAIYRHRRLTGWSGKVIVVSA